MEIRGGKKRRPVETGGTAIDESSAGNNGSKDREPERWLREGLGKSGDRSAAVRSSARISGALRAASFPEKREKSPNDPKLSDRGGAPHWLRKSGCGRRRWEQPVGRAGAVRCSAWLGVTLGGETDAVWRPKRRPAEAPPNPLEAAQDRRRPACPASDSAQNSERSGGRVMLGTDGKTASLNGKRGVSPNDSSSATRRERRDSCQTQTKDKL